jgi:hypothetical protein
LNQINYENEILNKIFKKDAGHVLQKFCNPQGMMLRPNFLSGCKRAGAKLGMSFLMFFAYIYLVPRCEPRKLWFSTFFSSRHTKVPKKFGGTLIPKKTQIDKEDLFPKRRKRQSKEKEFGGTLGRSSRHTG